MREAMAVLMLALLWAACSAPLRLMRKFTTEPTHTLEPTLLPTLLPTSTLQPTPSPRPSPTTDLGPTPSPFPTFAIPSPSPTATAVRALDCRLDWQSPGSGIEFDRGEGFTVGWHVTNTGSAGWDPGSVEFTYLSGARLHRDPVVRLDMSVPPGQSVILTAEMRAPRNSTKYTTYWSLRQGDTFFCRVGLSIYVK